MAVEFRDNPDYKKNLSDTQDVFYLKYAEDAVKLIGAEGKFLDVGCGTGNALKLIADRVPSAGLFGIDVSSFFIEELQQKFNVKKYDGERIPYDDGTFDVTGSYTVLEHVLNPYKFLEEKIRVTKKGGYIITACPNFLGFFNKVRGFGMLEKLKRIALHIAGAELEMNAPIIREIFQSDDDAIVITCLPPVIDFMKKKKMKIIQASGIMSKQGRLISALAVVPGIRLFMPSCYVIAQK